MRSLCRPRTTTRYENALAALEGLSEGDYTLAAVAAVLHAIEAVLRLIDLMLDWVPEETARNRILADNPRALYDFGSAHN